MRGKKKFISFFLFTSRVIYVDVKLLCYLVRLKFTKYCCFWFRLLKLWYVLYDFGLPFTRLVRKILYCDIFYFSTKLFYGTKSLEQNSLYNNKRYCLHMTRILLNYYLFMLFVFSIVMRIFYFLWQNLHFKWNFFKFVC